MPKPTDISTQYGMSTSPDAPRDPLAQRVIYTVPSRALKDRLYDALMDHPDDALNLLIVWKKGRTINE